MKKAVIYSRVSTDEQSVENQIEQLRTMISQQDYMISHIYKDVMSGRVTDRPEFQQMLKDARLRKFDIIFIWSLDRFSREGISNTLSYLERLKKYGVAIKSYQESWLDTSDEGVGQLLISIMSWVAQQERKRISERTKAGLQRTDKRIGRPKGKKDSKPRKKTGYYRRWEK